MKRDNVYHEHPWIHKNRHDDCIRMSSPTVNDFTFLIREILGVKWILAKIQATDDRCNAYMPYMEEF